jgi:hypothetical protein
MERRAFLLMLGAVAADRERLLWTPGKKLISISQPTIERPTGKGVFVSVYPPSKWFYEVGKDIISADVDLSNLRLPFFRRVL